MVKCILVSKYRYEIAQALAVTDIAIILVTELLLDGTKGAYLLIGLLISFSILIATFYMWGIAVLLAWKETQ